MFTISLMNAVKDTTFKVNRNSFRVSRCTSQVADV